MDLYLVLDLSISLAQNENYEKSPKVKKAFNFAKTLIDEIDTNNVSIHLIYMVGNPVLAKNNIKESSLVKTLFKSLSLKNKRPVASDYKKLCELINSHKKSYNFEVLIVTDLTEEIPFPYELKLPCLLRFVILTDFNDEKELLSENLIATLECVSLNCGLSANFAPTIEELDGKVHFPMMIGDYKDENDIARLLGKEIRIVKDIEIVLSQNMTLKATVSPGLPKRLIVMDQEMISRQTSSEQYPVFRFVGAASISNLVKMDSNALAFEVCPRAGGTQINKDGFYKLFDALIYTKTVAVFVHSSGEECYLRPLSFQGDENNALMMHFYSSQYVDYRTPNDKQIPSISNHKFSYKTGPLYWNHSSDIQSEIAKLCRKLKKDSNNKTFYEDLYAICLFSVALGLSDFSPNFAQLLEKKARSNDVITNQHLIKVLEWLKAPDGFNLAANELSKLIQILST